MLGVDITKISRFSDASAALVKLVLHPHEVAKFNLAKNKPLFLASRWAIKEALFKADNKLGSFSKIKVQKKDRKYQYQNYQISTSTEGDYYVAVVVKI